MNWIGVFKASDTPSAGKELIHALAPRGVGSVITSTAVLPSGQYNMYYLFDGGYSVIAGPISFTV